MNLIKKFLKDESGLELSEYAIAAALIAVAAAAAFTTVGANVTTQINKLATKIGAN